MLADAHRLSAKTCRDAAKLLGQLVQHHEVRRTSILISADYLQLRGATAEWRKERLAELRDWLLEGDASVLH